MKVALIIKHPYRDYDWRVDICEVPDDMSYDQIKAEAEKKMLGPFEVLAITEKINLDRKLIPQSTLTTHDLNEIDKANEERK
jgi:hypothetical protein